MVKLTEYFIPLVNEAFGEHFTEKVAVRLKEALDEANSRLSELVGLAKIGRTAEDIAEIAGFDLETAAAWLAGKEAAAV